ncbi:MAG: hypothetical protein DHS20C16_07050 [Phycisphaerae bacterium]|nr:MAG: hypothetical protein DHS20C16_07050 [Phycisphaerae bacterium]
MFGYHRLSSLVVGSIVVVSIIVSGCTEAPPPQETASLRAINASPDSPQLDGCLQDGTVAFDAIGGQTPGTTYAEVAISNSSVNFVADGDDCVEPFLVGQNVSLAADSESTLLLINVFDEIETVLLTDDNSAPAAGMTRLRFVHAHPEGPEVDINLSDGTLLVDDISFRGVSEYLAIDAGEIVLQIRSTEGDAILRTFAAFTAEEGQVVTFFFLNTDDENVSPGVFFVRDVE